MEPRSPTSPGGIGELHKIPKFQKEKVMASFKSIIGYGSSRKAQVGSLPMDIPFEEGDVVSNEDTKRLRSGWRFGIKDAKAGLRNVHSQDALELPQPSNIEGHGRGHFLGCSKDPIAISEIRKVGSTRSKFSLDGEKESNGDKGSLLKTIISTKDGDIIPCETIERIALAQKAYLDNLLDEEIKLYGKFECDSKLEARGIYLKNLQEEEAKLFALPKNSKVTDVFIEHLEGQEREEDINNLVLQNEPNFPKQHKDAKVVRKLKLPQVFLTPPPCPSPHMHKAIIASRPLASMISSPMTSSHGDLENSNFASFHEDMQVMENGPIQEENNTMDEEHRSNPRQEQASGDGSEAIVGPNIDPEHQRQGIHRGVGTDEEWRTIAEDGVVFFNIDPQREGVHTGVGTDKEWRSIAKVSEELEVSTQTDPEEVPAAAEHHVEDSEAGRLQVRASFGKNVAELDAAIVHVHVQEEKMAKICSERAQGVSNNCNQSPILSRLAQAMGQSTGEVEAEDLESDVDSDDDLSFHETQEEFPVILDASEWPLGSDANSDIETSSQHDELFPDALPGDHNVERRGRSRDVGWFSSNDFRGLQNRTSLVSVGKSSTRKSNYTVEELQIPSMRRQPSGNSGIQARLFDGARDEDTQSTREVAVYNSGYWEQELSTRPLRRRSSTSSAILERMSTVAIGKSSGQVSWDAGGDASETHRTYPDEELTKRRLVRSQSSNNEAISARLVSEIARSDERSKDIAPINSIRKYGHWRPIRRDSSCTAILARLSAVAKCETIEPYSTKSSVCDNEEIFQEKPVCRRGSTSSAILGRLSEVVGNEDTVQPSLEGTSFEINPGDIYIEDQHVRQPRRRSSSSSGTVILARLSSIVNDNGSSTQSSQQSSEDIIVSRSTNPRQELLEAPARKQSISSSSGSATRGRLSRSASAKCGNSQQSSHLSPLNMFSKEGGDDPLRVLTRQRSSSKSTIIPPKLFEVSREETSQQFLTNVGAIVGKSSNDYGEIYKTSGSRRGCSDYGQLYYGGFFNTPAYSRRGSSSEAILSRLSEAIGNKQMSDGDQTLETRRNRMEQEHENPLPLARVEIMQRLNETSAQPISCINYRTQEIEKNNKSTGQQEFPDVRSTEVIDSMGQQESLTASDNGRKQPKYDWNIRYEREAELGAKSTCETSSSGGERSTFVTDSPTAGGYIYPDIMRSPSPRPILNTKVEETCLLTTQERETAKALEQVRRESLDRMNALEQLQVPDFDELAQEQCRARESIARMRKLMSEDQEAMNGMKDQIFLSEHLIGQESGSARQTHQRRDSEKKKIEVQRTWVALMEEREIAKALDQLSKENMGRVTLRSLAPP